MGKKRIAKIEGGGEVDEEKASQSKKKKKRKVLDIANIYINATYNNTYLTATDAAGNVLAWSSAGSAGFKGPRKATPYAASRVVDILMDKLEKVQINEVNIFVKGIGAGRYSAMRALTGKGLNVISMKDVTPVPYNGCKPPKPRRV